jgi:hypothetical protein
MKTKKGMLLTEEVLKMVIAVIGLALLAYLLVAFFSSDIKAKNKKDAAATIDEIAKNIPNLTTSGIKISFLQPQRWTLFGFVGEEEKPNQCTNQNCMCICKKVVGGNVLDRQIKECTKEGSCLIIVNLNDFEDIKIEPYTQGETSINIQEINGRIQINKI